MATPALSHTEKLSLKTKLFFGAGDIFGGGAFNIINFFYAIFLSDVVNLNMLHIGPIILIGRVWDAVTDPLMGYISDHTRSRFGRRRPYFLIGSFLVFIAFIMVWYPVETNSEVFRFLYVLVSYLFFNTVVTLVMIPYTAMSAELTLDYHERTSLNSIRLIFSLTSSLLCALFPLQIVNAFGDDVRMGYVVMSVIFGALFALPWLGVFKYTYERPEFQRDRIKLNWKRLLIDPLKIRSFRLILLMFLATFLAMDVVSMIFAYYMKYYIRQEAFLPLVLGVLLIVEIAFVPVFSRLARKTSKTNAYIIGALVWMLGALVIFFLPATVPIWVVFLLAAIIGAGISGPAVMPHTLFGDVTDVGELYFNERREGSFSGLITFIRKIASGLSIAAVTFILGLSGFLNPEEQWIDGQRILTDMEQPDSVLLSIRIIIAFVPIALVMMGIVAAKKYPLTPALHQKLIKYLSDKRAGKKQSEISSEEVEEMKKTLI